MCRAMAAGVKPNVTDEKGNALNVIPGLRHTRIILKRSVADIQIHNKTP